METYRMIYKKLEIFNNYKITNIILYILFTKYSQFIYTFLTNSAPKYDIISVAEREKSSPSDRSLTIYSKGSKDEHMNIWTYEHMNICSLVIIAMSKFG